MTLRTEVLTPECGLAAVSADIARLRVEVFRDWPYLYDGSLDYERDHMRDFCAKPGAVAVIARDGTRIVGAATGMPLGQAGASVRRPLAEAGFAPDSVFYCAEAVLTPAYRGRGLYRSFFDGRENHARTLGGFKISAFCGIRRPADHPMKPENASELAPAWRHFGYAPLDGVSCETAWRDVGDAEKSPKTLDFWAKSLRDHPMENGKVSDKR